MEDQAIHVKGLRLGYATSDRWPCHPISKFYKPELSEMIDPDPWSEQIPPLLILDINQ